MTPRRRPMVPWLAVGALLASAPRLAAAADPQAVPAPPGEPRLAGAVPGAPEDEIVVTGTRALERTRLETLAPVDVLSSGSLAHQVTTELAQALETLAPSLSFARPALTDGTDHIRPASLRGLAPDRLVLVNSRRRLPSALVNVNGSVGCGSAAVDLNAIPLAALESLEVVRDGASAQYGSDAIAGVIKLRLRAAREGGESSLSYGRHLTSVSTRRGQRRERDGAALGASSWLGLLLGSEGFLTLPGEFRHRDPTSRGDFDHRVRLLPAPEPLRVTSRCGDAEARDVSAYANLGLPLGAGDWELYAWLGYPQRDGESAAFPRLAEIANNVPSLYPHGFLPRIASDIEDHSAASGVRCTPGGWRTDLSVVYGRNRIAHRTEDSVKATLGDASPTEFDGGSLAYTQLAANAGWVRELVWGGAERASLALGAELRRETFEIDAGAPDSYRAGASPPPNTVPGAQGFPGFQPANQLTEQRSALGAYAELEAPLTQRLRSGLAARAEDYSDFGSALTAQLEPGLSVAANEPADLRDQVLDARWLFDLELRADLGERLSLAVGRPQWSAAMRPPELHPSRAPALRPKANRASTSPSSPASSWWRCRAVPCMGSVWVDRRCFCRYLRGCLENALRVMNRWLRTRAIRNFGNFYM